MKLYINIKSMSFEEENNLIKHEIVLFISDIEFYGYEHMLELPDENRFIRESLKIIYKKDDKGKDTEEIDYKQFIVREEETWWSYPIYEIINGEIKPFNHKGYQYFSNTDRRMALAKKINHLYNPSSEAKILRRTLAYIMDSLELKYPDGFDIMNKKIEDVINKNLKDNKK